MNNHDTYREVLDKKGHLVSVVIGNSMHPLLRERKDSIHLVKLKNEPKRYDVVLYQRTNGEYIFHRILKVEKDKLIVCGDNQWKKETINREQIIGIGIGFYRKEKYISSDDFWYKIYSRIQVLLRQIRWLRDICKGIIKRIFK